MSNETITPESEQDLERVQEFLKVTFDTINQGITIYDSELRLVAWNELYTEMGITPPQHLYYGSYLLDAYIDFAKAGIFGPGEPRELAQERIEGLRSGPLIKSEILTPPTGRTIRINRFLLPNGGICATFNDVTDEIKIEAQLRQSQKMEAIGKLTGGVAHDVNNVLAIVTGNLELALEKIHDPDTTRLIRAALDASDRGAKLTHRLLAFARQQPLSPEVTKAGELLSGILDMLRKLLGEDIEVELVTDAGSWYCEVDRNQLENVIVNLAVNARDAMVGGGKMTIEAANMRIDNVYAESVGIEPGQYVCLSVTDTGCGMEKDVIDKAFDPFFTTKDIGRGTGLGLSMAHGFVRQSEGHIKIYSELNEGTVVKIYLPRVGAGSDEGTRTNEVNEKLATDAEVVLVVEDDSDLRSIVVNQLTSLGYQALSAPNGKKGLEIIKQGQQIDLLLTDVVLPGGMSGRQLSDLAADINPDLPTIFMSGYTENAIFHHGRLDQGVKLLQKPFRKADLANILRSTLDSR